VRLVTFNLLHGRSPSDDRVDLDRLRRAVHDLNPDVFALQEVDRDQPRSHMSDLTEVVAQEMGAVAHRFVAALSGTPGATWIAATGREQPGTASYGIALLSRYPSLNWQVLRLPKLPGPLPVWLPEPRKLVVVREEPRAVVIGTLRTPTGTLTVANTHLSFVPGWNRVQLNRIRRNLRPFDDPVVLMGDLNLTPPAPTRISGYTSLAAESTFPVGDPHLQLDHVLVRGWHPEVIGAAAVATELSDHRALMVEVADPICVRSYGAGHR
jgi:endonuclease/exonuclease/phosphatase family metal-dependent hydrolase